ECQPDLVEAAVQDAYALGKITSDERDRRIVTERQRVQPAFNSLRYGTATYGQLAGSCAEEITCGADDRAEMGAFHDLLQAPRLAALRTRLDEYTPAGMDPGIIFVT